MPGPKAAQVRSALALGAIGCQLMAVGWAIVLLALGVAIAARRASFVDDVLGSFGMLGLFGLIAWIAGSVVQTPGWIALRMTRGGHARGIAFFAVLLAAAYLAVVLMALWGLPFLWLPTVGLLCLWHVLTAVWFWRRQRATALLHASTAIGIGLALAGGYYRAVVVLLVGAILAGLAAIGAYLLSARYMLRVRPFESVEAVFE